MRVPGPPLLPRLRPGIGLSAQERGPVILFLTQRAFMPIVILYHFIDEIYMGKDSSMSVMSYEYAVEKRGRARRDRSPAAPAPDQIEGLRRGGAA